MTLLMRLYVWVIALTQVNLYRTVAGDDQDKAEQFALRLRDGDAEYEGRLEIFYNGHWGTICGLGWTNSEGNVACKELGFYGVFAVQDARHFGEGTGPILLKDVTCLGGEARLTDCYHSDWYVNNCDQMKVVGLRCLVSPPPDPLYEIRLVGGNSIMEGRVEIFYNGNWGSVCRDGWEMEDAIVVCRQLNFGPPKTDKHYFGAGSGPVLMSFVSCFGYEVRLLECPVQSSSRRSECTHHFDVGVICNEPSDPFPLTLEGGSLPHEGRVSLYYHGKYGTICSEGWDLNDAEVVCRQLGYGSARQAYDNAQLYFDSAPTHYAIHLSDVDCDGTESYLAACSHGIFGNNSCTHSLDAGVECAAPSEKEYKLRLVGGSSNHEGQLEIFYKGHWGAICDHQSWDIIAANVACRQIGVGPALTAKADFNAVTIVAYLNNVICTGSEKRLIDCSNDGVGERLCGDMGVVSLQCSTYTIPGIETENSLRLVAGSLPYEGRVEMYRNHTWGTICSNQWDIADARVVCRQLGYGAALANTTAFDKGRTAQTLVDNMACTGEEDALTDCQHGKWGECDAFTYYGDAGVICNAFGHGGYFESSFQSKESPYPLRLFGGYKRNEGYLEIRVGETWGTIAETNILYWNATGAQVACHQLGYDGAIDVKLGGIHSGDSKPIHLTDVRCRGNEGTIDICSHSRWGQTDHLNHSNDVYIVCDKLSVLLPPPPLPPQSTNRNQEESTIQPTRKISARKKSPSIGIVVLIVMSILSVIAIITGIVLYYRARIRQSFPHLYPGAVRL